MRRQINFPGTPAGGSMARGIENKGGVTFASVRLRRLYYGEQLISAIDGAPSFAAGEIYPQLFVT